MRKPPFKYHLVLKDIYEKKGSDWFRFSEYWQVGSLKDETQSSISSKMSTMIQYRDTDFYLERKSNIRIKPYLLKKTYREVKHLFPNATHNERRSNYWKITIFGMVELVNVFGSEILKEEDSVKVAKFCLGGGVKDSI